MMAANEHNRLVGIFLIVHGAIQGLILLFVGLIYLIAGVAMAAVGTDGEQRFAGVAIFIIAIVFVVIFGLLYAGPQILGGYKLLKERPNARIWGIVGSIVACLAFPLGTAAGVYGLWFLFGDIGKQYYLGGNNQNMFQNSPQAPPPNSWQ